MTVNELARKYAEAATAEEARSIFEGLVQLKIEVKMKETNRITEFKTVGEWVTGRNGNSVKIDMDGSDYVVNVYIQGNEYDLGGKYFGRYGSFQEAEKTALRYVGDVPQEPHDDERKYFGADGKSVKISRHDGKFIAKPFLPDGYQLNGFVVDSWEEAVSIADDFLYRDMKILRLFEVQADPESGEYKCEPEFTGDIVLEKEFNKRKDTPEVHWDTYESRETELDYRGNEVVSEETRAIKIVWA